jgi:lipoprotein-releasing system permease protein
MNFVIKVALRYIFAKTSDRFISFISAFCLAGITIGVASLIIVMAIMNGFHQELTKCIIGLNGHIIISGEHDLLKEQLQHYDFVKDVSTLIEGQGMLSSRDNSSGVLVKGISASDLCIKTQIINSMQEKGAELNKGDAILIGQELAAQMHLKLGDKVKLIVPQTIASILGSMPKSKDFIVAGIFNSGLRDYDAMNVIIPIATAAKIFTNNKVLLEVYTKNADQVNSYTKQIFNDWHNKIDFINNWQITNSSTLQALKVEKVAMFAVLSLIITVAAFNIIASLFMLVKEKAKDIAILRTIGASQKTIMLIFMINGFIIGLCGTFLGVGLGLVVSCNINTIKGYLEYFSGIKIFDSAVYFLYNLPAQLDTSDMWFVCLLSLTLSFISTIYPAYRAAKLNPVEAMRYE